MNRLELKVPPVVVFLLVGIAMWWLAGRVPAATLAIPGAIAVIVVLAIAGAFLGVSGVLHFRRHETTVHPNRPEKASTVVTTGVYRFTRNPMYLGLALLLTAWATKLGNAAAFAGVIVFIAYMTRFQVMPEERALLALFGDDYARYKQTVRRWL